MTETITKSVAIFLLYGSVPRAGSHIKRLVALVADTRTEHDEPSLHSAYRVKREVYTELGFAIG